jgi:hypothetical protein
VGALAEANGGDGAGRGGEGGPCHAAGGGERGGARGLPGYVERDFAKYLECRVSAHGFARVRCESCKDELLVGFSCKGRGGNSSFKAKRAQAHRIRTTDDVLRGVAGMSGTGHPSTDAEES